MSLAGVIHLLDFLRSRGGLRQATTPLTLRSITVSAESTFISPDAPRSSASTLAKAELKRHFGSSGALASDAIDGADNSASVGWALVRTAQRRQPGSHMSLPG